MHQLFTHDRNGDEVQRIEFFFRIDNPEDFVDVALHNTTHGALEMNDMGFRRLREISILPGFLADFFGDSDSLSQKSDVIFFRTEVNDVR